jgi:5-methylcytosine-specific restriction protein A
MKKPLKPCNKIGCNSLTREGYCDIHKEEKQLQQREYDRNVRDQKHKQYYNSVEWKKARELALMRDNFLCVKCRLNGKLKQADVVDHITELQDDFSLRSTLTNLQSLCHSCHNRKTEEERKKRRK